MELEKRFLSGARERLAAMMLAAAATFLVFAAINAGFTPHAADLVSRAFSQPTLSL